MKKLFLYIIVFLTVSVAGSPLYSQNDKRKPETPPQVLVPAEEKQPELTIVDSILYVKNAPVGSKLEIITIVGSKVKEIEIKSSDETIELNLSRAIYIFKLEGTVRKFVIK